MIHVPKVKLLSYAVILFHQENTKGIPSKLIPVRSFIFVTENHMKYTSSTKIYLG